MRLRLFLKVLLLMVVFVPVQQARAVTLLQAPIPPAIITSGQGEVRVTPDQAQISLSVQSRASTAAVAASDNAQKQTAVISALRMLGIGAPDISTENYTLTPETKYDKDGGLPRVVSYLVTNQIRVAIKQLDNSGKVIDAGLAYGASEISSIAFTSSNSEGAYVKALDSAVVNARAHAEVIARAAGGRLGSMIEMSNNGSAWVAPAPQFMRSMVAGAQQQTPVLAGQQTVTASVTGKWLFIPDP